MSSKIIKTLEKIKDMFFKVFKIKFRSAYFFMLLSSNSNSKESEFENNNFFLSKSSFYECKTLKEKH